MGKPNRYNYKKGKLQQEESITTDAVSLYTQVWYKGKADIEI
jgi:hypothetical protein